MTTMELTREQVDECLEHFSPYISGTGHTAAELCRYWLATHKWIDRWESSICGNGLTLAVEELKAATNHEDSQP